MGSLNAAFRAFLGSQLGDLGVLVVRHFLTTFCRRITQKPEGFTEYSRRQCPRLLRATPPVGLSSCGSATPSASDGLCGWLTGGVAPAEGGRALPPAILCKPFGFCCWLLPYLITGSLLPALSPERLWL